MPKNHLLGAACLLLVSVSCGGSSTETPDSTSSTSDALSTTATLEEDANADGDDEDSTAEDDADAMGGADEWIVEDAAGDPTYIVYYVPLTNTALYRDVLLFTQLFKSAATNLPPHVSVTGFFSSILTEGQAGDLFRKTVNGVVAPFGKTPRVGSVHCRTVTDFGATAVKGKKPKNYLVDIHLTFEGNRWPAFEHALFKAFNIPKSKQRDVSTYHITLFEARVGSVTHKKFHDVCTAAKAKFPAAKNATTYAGTQFGTALFEQRGTGVVQIVNTSFQVTK